MMAKNYCVYLGHILLILGWFVVVNIDEQGLDRVIFCLFSPDIVAQIQTSLCLVILAILATLLKRTA